MTNAQAALEADPFLPAIERLQRELIPDHPAGCECAYSSHDAARWRPL